MKLHEVSFFRFKDIFCTLGCEIRNFPGNPHPHLFWFNAENEAKNIRRNFTNSLIKY